MEFLGCGRCHRHRCGYRRGRRRGYRRRHRQSVIIALTFICSCNGAPLHIYGKQ